MLSKAANLRRGLTPSLAISPVTWAMPIGPNTWGGVFLTNQVVTSFLNSIIVSIAVRAPIGKASQNGCDLVAIVPPSPPMRIPVAPWGSGGSHLALTRTSLWRRSGLWSSTLMSAPILSAMRYPASPRFSTGWPSMLRMASPGWMPACSAGEPAATSCTTTCSWNT